MSPDQPSGNVDGPLAVARANCLPECPFGGKDLRGSLYQALAVCAFLILAVALIFAQTAQFDFFNLDDNANVYQNPHITGGLTAAELKWAFTERYMGAYWPLTWISFMLDYQVYGLNPGGFHVTNVLLHAATAVLLFLVLRQMTGRLWPSALVAAVFAVHPLRAESVAWVTERKDVLSGLFFVLALGAYVSYTRHRFSFVRYAAVAVLFAMGLMAKPMLVTFPFVLWLLDYWPLERWNSRNAARLVLEKIPLLVLTACSCVVTIWAFRADTVLPAEHGFPLVWRIENAILTYVGYVGMFFCPVGLATGYPVSSFELPLWKVCAAAILLVVLTVAVLVRGRKYPYLPVGWLWYLGMLVPVIGLCQFGFQTMADRFTYLPQIGFCIALAWGMADTLKVWPRLRPVYGALAAVVLVTLMACAWHQTTFWRDSVTGWTRTLECTSQNKLAHNSLGNAYLDLGQTDKAMEQYRAAIALEPDCGLSNYNLGAVLGSAGRTDEAIRQYQQAIRNQPNLAETKDRRAGAVFLALSHFNLGVALAETGRIDEAVEQYRKTIELQPNHISAHNNLGSILVMQGQSDLAMAHFQQALQIDPGFAEAHFNAGNIHYRRGAFEQAIEEYQQALKINPHLVRVRYALGLALAKCDRPEQAIGEYRKALEAKPEFAADVHNSFGLALVACGRRDEAIVEYRNALAIRPDFPKARYNLDKALAGGN